MKLLPFASLIVVPLLASCTSNKHWFEVPHYEIAVRDSKGILSGANAQLTVASRPHPMSSSARASTYFSEAEKIYRIDGILHDRKTGWLLASPNFRAPYNEVRRYVFEFRFQRPKNPSSWSEWMPVSFLTVGGVEWDLLYKTDREQRLQAPDDTGLLMRHRTTTWAERQTGSNKTE